MGERLSSALADLFLIEESGRSSSFGTGAVATNWATAPSAARSQSLREPFTDGGLALSRLPASATATRTSLAYIRHALAEAGRMETLSKAMGHASIAITVDLYGHLDLSDVARDLALVEGSGEINPLHSEGL
jgi:hypothetical protein